ncbi:hypothetical protein [Candidatus Chlorohelix sp.]|uniref:hypothetical protein n=1 Tax=Candidatus Chlorohelix sp. TaxID=3139201 RepID=UPI003065D75A
MALRKQDISPPKLEYYYDTHPTQEDLVSESTFQSELIHYLIEMLWWYYRAKKWFIVTKEKEAAWAKLRELGIDPEKL